MFPLIVPEILQGAYGQAEELEGEGAKRTAALRVDDSVANNREREFKLGHLQCLLRASILLRHVQKGNHQSHYYHHRMK